MQIVYISNRPARFIETIAHIDDFMSVITEDIVTGPESQQAKYGNLESRTKFAFISEEERLGDKYGSFQHLDHQERNFLLRTGMACHPDWKNTMRQVGQILLVNSLEYSVITFLSKLVIAKHHLDKNMIEVNN